MCPNGVNMYCPYAWKEKYNFTELAIVSKYLVKATTSGSDSAWGPAKVSVQGLLLAPSYSERKKNDEI